MGILTLNLLFLFIKFLPKCVTAQENSIIINGSPQSFGTADGKTITINETIQVITDGNSTTINQQKGIITQGQNLSVSGNSEGIVTQELNSIIINGNPQNNGGQEGSSITINQQKDIITQGQNLSVSGNSEGIVAQELNSIVINGNPQNNGGQEGSSITINQRVQVILTPDENSTAVKENPQEESLKTLNGNQDDVLVEEEVVTTISERLEDLLAQQEVETTEEPRRPFCIELGKLCLISEQCCSGLVCIDLNVFPFSWLSPHMPMCRPIEEE